MINPFGSSHRIVGCCLSAVALLTKHVASVPPAPSSLAPGIPPELDAVVTRLLAKDPKERYQSWQELIDDVRGQIEGRDSLDFEKDARARRR